MLFFSSTQGSNSVVCEEVSGQCPCFSNYGGRRCDACTPGYYNNEGQDPGPAARLAVGYPAGPLAYFHYLDRWRSSGGFEGLEFR